MSNVKVFYGSNNFPDYDDDHSAVTTSNSNVFISKMGCGVLCSHLKTNSPYDGSDLRYFTTLQVNSPQVVCSGNTATFTTLDYVDCTYAWTYNTNLLNYVSGQGTKSFVVEPKNSTSTGEAWVTLEVTIDLDQDVTRTITKNVWVGRPDANDFTVYVDGSSRGPFELCEGEQYYISLYPYFLFDDQGITDVEFDFTFDYDVLDEGDDYIEIEVNFPPEDEEGEVYVTTDCGYYTLKFMDFEDGCGGYYMMMSPNPATTETTVTLQSANENEPIDENIEWELEVYSPTQILKETKNKLKGKAHKIQTNGWKAGVYIVRAKYKDKIIPGKLVVQD